MPEPTSSGPMHSASRWQLHAAWLRDVRRRIKGLLGWLSFRTGLYRHFFRNKAVIVLFHRVDDRYAGDPITCTTDAFLAFCEFFRQYFVVVSLEALLEKVRRGDDISRHLSITFDDGYRDNAVTAAPMLSRLGLPACFFITTGFIETDRVASWDADAGIRSEWMTWEDVRGLHRSGFEIGAHTVNHLDLGSVGPQVAEAEVRSSRQRLERELSDRVRYFSYPFGRPECITDANREVVRAAQFECCVSAFGGVVVDGDDPFHMKRAPVSAWYTSPYLFGYQAMRRQADGPPTPT